MKIGFFIYNDKSSQEKKAGILTASQVALLSYRLCKLNYSISEPKPIALRPSEEFPFDFNSTEIKYESGMQSVTIVIAKNQIARACLSKMELEDSEGEAPLTPFIDFYNDIL